MSIATGANPVAETPEPNVERLWGVIQRVGRILSRPLTTPSAVHAAVSEARVIIASTGKGDGTPNGFDKAGGPVAETGALGPERPNELWFCDAHGDVTRWHEAKRGGVFASDPDDAPDSIVEDAPPGWSVFDGKVAPLTAEDMADEDHPAHSCGVPCQVGDEFWRGRLRPATPAEVCSFFGLATVRRAPSGEPEGGV